MNSTSATTMRTAHDRLVTTLLQRTHRVEHGAWLQASIYPEWTDQGHDAVDLDGLFNEAHTPAYYDYFRVKFIDGELDGGDHSLFFIFSPAGEKWLTGFTGFATFDAFATDREHKQLASLGLCADV